MGINSPFLQRFKALNGILMNKALITGISGQDGAFLSRSLLDKGWDVIGTTRGYSKDKFQNLETLGIADNIEIFECDLLDFSAIHKILNQYKPDLIFNLAAQSSVAKSFIEPIGTMHFNTISVLNLLESIKIIGQEVRFYQASSSEIFGKVDDLPITYKTPKHPLSHYAISKASAFWSTINYRESFGLKACSGILFNHESVFREPSFFTKKIVKQALEVKAGRRKTILVGNIDIARDMGCAREYVEAIIQMTLKDEMDDYLICTGHSVTLRSLVTYIFSKVGVDLDTLRHDQRFVRPNEISNIYGDPSRATEELTWSSQRSIYDVLDEMISYEQGEWSYE